MDDCDYDYDNYLHDYGYDDGDYDDGDYDNEEPTWLYEWRGHYFYDRPTMKQKIQAVLGDFKRFVLSKVGYYDNDITF